MFDEPHFNPPAAVMDVIHVAATLVIKEKIRPSPIPGIPDSDSTDDMLINRRAGWISFQRDDLAELVAKALGAEAQADAFVDEFRDAFETEHPLESINPFVAEAFGDAYALTSTHDDRVNLHFVVKSPVSDFLTKFMKVDNCANLPA